MIRSLKRFALVALVSMSLLTATAVSVTAAEFHSEAAHTTWTGSQPLSSADFYTFNAGSWKCNEISYSGTTTTATSTALTMAPAFNECTAFGAFGIPHHVNGCQYRYQAQGSPGTMDIVCPEGKAIVITAFACQITIPPQTGLSGVVYTNWGSGSGRSYTIEIAVSGLKYSQSTRTFPGCTNGSFANGTYKGAVEVKGANTVGNQLGVWVA